MSENMNKKTERLFDAIGAIDDALIQDALSPSKAREHIARRKKMRISIVSAACVCCIIVGVLLRLPTLDSQPPTNSPAPDHSSGAPAATDTQKEPAGDGHAPEEVPLSLEQALANIGDSQKVTRLSADEIDLHDRDAKLIWQYEGEEHYNVAAITESSSLRLITAELDRPLTDLSADESDRISIKLWIAYGDGRVDSPYLKHTPGNTGYGVLFDYCAEVEPNTELAETVLKLII